MYGSTGESDIVLDLVSGGGESHRLLIENKIGASFGPDQAERYRMRADEAVASGDCASCPTVLIAPQTYLGEGPEAFGFDAVVEYESISSRIAASGMGPALSRFFQAAIQGAIEKATPGYQMEEDAAVTGFWRAYWELAEEIAPELEMQEPGGRPAKSSFVHFRPGCLPAGLHIVHKMGQGNVDLEYAGMGARFTELRLSIGDRLEPDMELHRTGRSAVVRLRVPVLRTARPFEAQREAAAAGLGAAVSFGAPPTRQSP